MKIAIDLGQQYLKGVADNGKRVMIKSVTSDGHQSSHKSFSGKALKGMRNLQVEVTYGGKTNTHYVGELAEKFGALLTYAIGRDGFKSENALILVWTTIALLVPENKRGERIDLALDFPFGQYDNLAENFVKYIRSHKPKVNLGSGDYEIQLGEITTYPQGWAAAYGVQGKFPELAEEEGLNAFVDIGGETTDIVVVENMDGELFLHEELSGTLSHGMKDLRKVIQQSFQLQTGNVLETTFADKAVEKGSLYYAGNQYDFANELKRGKEQLATIIKEFLTQLWSNKKPWIRSVFWAGGGADTLKEYLQGFHPSEKILENAQWANAEGCLLASGGKLIAAQREVAATIPSNRTPADSKGGEPKETHTGSKGQKDLGNDQTSRTEVGAGADGSSNTQKPHQQSGNGKDNEKEQPTDQHSDDKQPKHPQNQQGSRPTGGSRFSESRGNGTAGGWS